MAGYCTSQSSMALSPPPPARRSTRRASSLPPSPEPWRIMAEPHATILPVDALALAHDAVDSMVEKCKDLPNADSVWIMAMTVVKDLEDEQKIQNLSLLLTVTLQRLAQQ